MNHGQIEVPELLQVQKEGGRGLEAVGAAEGSGGGKNRQGRIVPIFCFPFLSLILYSFLSLLFGYFQICLICSHKEF